MASHNLQLLPCIHLFIWMYVDARVPHHFCTLPSSTNSSCTARPKACGYPWQHVQLAEHPVIAHAHWGKHGQVVSCPQLLMVFYRSSTWVPLQSISTTVTPMPATTAAPTKRSHHINADTTHWWSIQACDFDNALVDNRQQWWHHDEPQQWQAPWSQLHDNLPHTPLSNNPADLVPRRQHPIRSCTPTTLLVANHSQRCIRIRLRQLPRHAARRPHVLHVQRCRASPSRKLLLQRHCTSLRCTFPLHLLYPTLQLTHLLFSGRSNIRPFVYSDLTRPRTHCSSHTHQAACIRCSILKGACSPTFPATILLWLPQFLSPIP